MDSEFYQRLAATQDEFTREDAAALFLDLSPNGKQVEFLQDVIETGEGQTQGLASNGNLVLGMGEFERIFNNPFILNKKDDPFSDIELFNHELQEFKQILKCYSEILQQLDYVLQNSGSKTISREKLKNLALARQEKPVFLFPESKVKPLDPRKENTLYALIGILAQMKPLKLSDRESVSKVQRKLEQSAVRMSDDTIRAHLKKASEILEYKTD